MFWFLLILGGIVGLLYLLVIDVWRIPADDAQLAASVEPVMSAGDVVLVLRNGQASPGHLARCQDPQEAARFVTARVIASEHEAISVSGRAVVVDKKLQVHPRACPSTTMKNPGNGLDVTLQCTFEDTRGSEHPMYVSTAEEVDDTVSTEVENGKVYLLSDNRALHLDSRDFGQLPASSCKTVLFRLWGATGWFDDQKRMTLLW
jgi:signal peptidase I